MPATASLHHLIIAVSDRDAASAFFVDLLGLRPPWENGFFQSVQLDDHVVVNFAAPPVEIQPQHYAFLVPDAEFDRIQQRFDREGTPYTADPPGQRPGDVGAVNPDGTGRRLYFRAPTTTCSKYSPSATTRSPRPRSQALNHPTPPPLGAARSSQGDPSTGRR